MKKEQIKKDQIKKAQDFLGVKVLNTLEEKIVVGGLKEYHEHIDKGRHHHHRDEVD